MHHLEVTQSSQFSQEEGLKYSESMVKFNLSIISDDGIDY